jgi:hypothetical protein
MAVLFLVGSIVTLVVVVVVVAVIVVVLCGFGRRGSKWWTIIPDIHVDHEFSF